MTTPPKLDDFIGASAAKQPEPITTFIQRNPEDGKPVSSPVSAWLSYDDSNLYAVFVCKVAPGQLRARFSKRDDAFADDVVAIFLDTFHDRQHSYEFFVNPYGIQMDGIITEGQNDDFRFDTYWHSEGRITADGFAVRMAIPFKSLRFSKDEKQKWAIGLGRFIPSKNESSFWPYITRKQSGFTPQLSNSEGIEHVSPGRNIRLIPYGAFGASRSLNTPSSLPPYFDSRREWRGGVDAKVVIHNSLTLDATINPDFSQVESDSPQVTVNQRYEVFFPEKRPFFLENSSYFETQDSLLFTRRIADPSAGARLTGRLGQWTIGALAVTDRAPGKRVASTDAAYGDTTIAGVLRVQRSVGKESTVGMFLSTYDFSLRQSRVGAIDTRLKLSKTWQFQGQASYSNADSTGAPRQAGPAYMARIARNGLHFNYSSRYTDRSGSFRTDLGFIPRVDIRQTSNNLNYAFRPKKSVLASYGAYGNYNSAWDHNGRLQDWSASGNFFFDFRNTTYFEGGRYESYEFFGNRGFRKYGTEFYGSTNRWKWVSISSFFGTGRNINYSPAAGLTPFLAGTQYGNTYLTFRPSKRLRIQPSYIYSQLNHVFTNHIARTTVGYTFSPSLSVRTIFDYNAVLPNRSLVAVEQTKSFTGDVLVSYLPHPGTGFYVGYTNRRENLAMLAGPPASLLRRGDPSFQTAGQLFVKVSYLIRF